MTVPIEEAFSPQFHPSPQLLYLFCLHQSFQPSADRTFQSSNYLPNHPTIAYALERTFCGVESSLNRSG